MSGAALKTRAGITLLALSLAPLTGLEAQRHLNLNLSAHAVYAVEAFSGAFGWGGTARLQFDNIVQIMAIADYYMDLPACRAEEDCRYWSASANLMTGGARGRLRPRLGAGVIYQERSLEGPEDAREFDLNDVGLNLILDVEYLGLLGPFEPYAQARYELVDQFKAQVVLAGGIRF